MFVEAQIMKKVCISAININNIITVIEVCYVDDRVCARSITYISTFIEVIEVCYVDERVCARSIAYVPVCSYMHRQTNTIDILLFGS